jgi:hypothetical protein
MERTADPSASLGMTNGRMALRFCVVVGEENRRSLGCARDDKGNNLVILCVFVASGSCALKPTGNIQAEGKNVERP